MDPWRKVAALVEQWDHSYLFYLLGSRLSHIAIAKHRAAQPMGLLRPVMQRSGAGRESKRRLIPCA